MIHHQLELQHIEEVQMKTLQAKKVLAKIKKMIYRPPQMLIKKNCKEDYKVQLKVKIINKGQSSKKMKEKKKLVLEYKEDIERSKLY